MSCVPNVSIERTTTKIIWKKMKIDCVMFNIEVTAAVIRVWIYYRLFNSVSTILTFSTIFRSFAWITYIYICMHCIVYTHTHTWSVSFLILRSDFKFCDMMTFFIVLLFICLFVFACLYCKFFKIKKGKKIVFQTFPMIQNPHNII